MSATLRNGGTKFEFTSFPPSGEGVTVKFPAFIDSISDSYGGTWAEHMDMGRGDPKFMYQQYSRTLNVSFKIVSTWRRTWAIWWQALNTLTEMTKPQYKADIGFNGVFCHMTIGGLISERGFIESVDVNVDNETPWISQGDGSDNHLPLIASVDVSFRVVGLYKPNYKSGNYGGFTPYKDFTEGNTGKEHIPDPTDELGPPASIGGITPQPSSTKPNTLQMRGPNFPPPQPLPPPGLRSPVPTPTRRR